MGFDSKAENFKSSIKFKSNAISLADIKLIRLFARFHQIKKIVEFLGNNLFL